jgi:hypothetical protein
MLLVPMAESAKPEVTEAAKMDLLENDDEFEEFEIDQGMVPCRFLALRCVL